MRKPLPIILLTMGFLTACWLGLIRTGYQAMPRPAASHAQVQQELGTFAKLAKSLKPVVVNIGVDKSVGAGGPLGLEDAAAPHTHGQGSGVIISTDGFILTNNHVVSNASEVRVTTADGREYPATVVGTDPKTDLALVKVDGHDLPAAQLGDSEALQVGDWVMAIGNPFGLEATVTVGVLSGKGRAIGVGLYDDFLQTDASINPGNSGGPLFNLEGKVVGINTAIQANGQGIGFSIPVNMARDIVAQLKSNGRVVRGYLGVGIQALTPALKQALSLPADLKGALISSVQPNGPASQAGMQVSDIVTAINGRPVASDRDLLAQVARTPVDSEAKLSVLRDGQNLTLSLKVAQRPDDQPVAVAPATVPANPRQNGLGVQVRDLNADLAAQLAVTNPEGVCVIQVAMGSPAARAGLRPGDVIRKLGTTPVRNTVDFIRAFEKAHQTHAPVALLVERAGSTVFMVVET